MTLSRRMPLLRLRLEITNPRKRHSVMSLFICPRVTDIMLMIMWIIRILNRIPKKTKLLTVLHMPILPRSPRRLAAEAIASSREMKKPYKLSFTVLMLKKRKMQRLRRELLKRLQRKKERPSRLRSLLCLKKKSREKRQREQLKRQQERLKRPRKRLQRQLKMISSRKKMMIQITVIMNSTKMRKMIPLR